MTEVEEAAFVFVFERGGHGCSRRFLSSDSLEAHLRQTISVCPGLTFPRPDVVTRLVFVFRYPIVLLLLHPVLLILASGVFYS